MISVVSCATQNNSGLENFKNSFSSFSGWKVQIIGLGEKWDGWKTKIQIYIDFLQKQKNPEELTVLIDGYDVLCVRNAENFKEIYESFSYPIIIGFETLCFSNNCRPPSQYYKMHNQKKIYPNSGCIVGKVKDLLFLWNWVLENGLLRDDQIAVSHFMDAFPQKVVLDTQNKIVYNDTFIKCAKIDIKSDKILVNDKFKPYFIHFPGFKLRQSLCWNKISEYPPNYLLVGKQVCKENFIKEMSVLPKVFYPSLIGIILLCFLVIIVIFFLFKIRNNKGRK